MGIDNTYGTLGLRPGVCTSTSRPGSPYEGQTVYETDTDKLLVYNGSAWYAPWNTAWGVIAYTTSQSNTISSEVVSGLTTTFTAVNNRRYKITAHLSTNLSSGRHIFSIATTSIGSQRIQDISETGYPHAEGVFIGTGNGSSQTVQVKVVTVSGTIALSSDDNINKHFLLIEDVGPA